MGAKTIPRKAAPNRLSISPVSLVHGLAGVRRRVRAGRAAHLLDVAGGASCGAACGHMCIGRGSSSAAGQRRISRARLTRSPGTREPPAGWCALRVTGWLPRRHGTRGTLTSFLSPPLASFLLAKLSLFLSFLHSPLFLLRPSLLGMQNHPRANSPPLLRTRGCARARCVCARMRGYERSLVVWKVEAL